MAEEEQLPGSGATRTIERGETYDHAVHGRVEVTGIWQRTRPLDAVYEADDRAMIVVRYVPAENGTWVDELAESRDDFLEAVE